MASACSRLAIGLVLALVADPPGFSAPRVEVVVGAVRGASVLAPPSGADAGLYAFVGADGDQLFHLDKDGVASPLPLRRPLGGRPIAAAGLSETILAVVVEAAAEEAGEFRLVCLRRTLEGGMESLGAVPLPSPAPETVWRVAATPRWLFLGAGDRLWRTRHTASGVGEPRPFARLGAPIRGLAVDPKGYLAAFTRGGEEDGVVEFFDPNARSPAPLASWPLTLRSAGPIAFAASESDRQARLLVVSPAGLHRVEMAVAGDTLIAKPVLVWRPPDAIGVIAAAGGGQSRRPLYAVAGGVLHRVTPPAAD